MKKITYASLILFILTSCSSENTNNPDDNPPNVIVPATPVVDVEGNVYNTVNIDSQNWTTKNLNVSKYRNGDVIPQVTDPSQWANMTTGAWCYLHNDTANGGIYGKLYNWYALNDPRGLAPVGYHIPSETEWDNLISYSRPVNSSVPAAYYLKDPSGWVGYDCNNATGFSALGGGLRGYSGNFIPITQLKMFGAWWSSSQSNGSQSVCYYMKSSSYSVTKTSEFNYHGYSVRCIRN
jgi:uncharacterized protein (TIGR02145 family)